MCIRDRCHITLQTSMLPRHTTATHATTAASTCLHRGLKGKPPNHQVRIRTLRGPESSDPNFPMSEAAVSELVGPGKYGSYLFGPPRNSDPKFPRPGKFASELVGGKQIRILIFRENKGETFRCLQRPPNILGSLQLRIRPFWPAGSWIRISRGPES